MKNIRLYSTAKVTECVYVEALGDWEYEEVYSDVDYLEGIKEKINWYTRFDGKEFNRRGLMCYFDYEGEIYDNIREKVKSAFVSVTVLVDKNKTSKLFGICDLKVEGELIKEELNIICEYVQGQYSDGFGEGFEQQNIKVDIHTGEREIQMHFWDSERFFIETEEKINKLGYTDLYPLN